MTPSGRDASIRPTRGDTARMRGRTRRRRATVSLAALLGLALATSADAAQHVNYTGKTSQQRPIAFTITHSQITKLAFHIDDRCPGGRLLFVNDSGFPPMHISHAEFGGTFVAKAPQKATAIVRGTLHGATVSGTISDRTMNKQTHTFCSGKATFVLTHRRGASGRHGRGAQHSD